MINALPYSYERVELHDIRLNLLGIKAIDLIIPDSFWLDATMISATIAILIRLLDTLFTHDHELTELYYGCSYSIVQISSIIIF